MNEFIEIVERAGKRRLINVRHIEEIVECDENECLIYFDVSCGDSVDCCRIYEPYERIKLLIMQKGGASDE